MAGFFRDGRTDQRMEKDAWNASKASNANKTSASVSRLLSCFVLGAWGDKTLVFAKCSLVLPHHFNN